jgi:hypothetical protein
MVTMLVLASTCKGFKGHPPTMAQTDRADMMNTEFTKVT